MAERKGLRVVKQAVVGKTGDGLFQMLDQEVPLERGGAVVTLDNEAATVQVEGRILRIESGVGSPVQVTRTYDVGHPTRSGQTTELQLRGVMVQEGRMQRCQVLLDLGALSSEFPDRQSHLTIRVRSGQESVTIS